MDKSPDPAGSVDRGTESRSLVSTKSVLVVGINFAPETTGIAPYTTQIAEHLASLGAEVDVLSGPPSYPAWKVSAGYRRWRMHESYSGVNLTRLMHYIPKRQSALHRAAYEVTFGLRVLVESVRHRADLVLAVTPSLGGAAAAATIARLRKVPFVVHVQDVLGKAASQSGIQGGGAVADLVRRLEGWVLRRADSVVLVNDGFTAVSLESGVRPSKLHIVRNWTHVEPPSRDRQEQRRALGWADEVTVALHTGNMGLKQDLGNVIEAARLGAQRDGVLWVLMGEGSQRAALEEQARGLTNLVFLPPCDSLDYSNILGAADVLILNERPTVADMSLPSKLTSYFSAERPIVGAVVGGGSSEIEILRSGAGITVPAGSPQQLLDAVRALRADRRRGTDLARSGPTYVAAHTTKMSSLASLTRILDSVLRQSGEAIDLTDSPDPGVA